MQTAKLKYRVVTDGLEFPEGPIVLADGSVLVCLNSILARVQNTKIS